MNKERILELADLIEESTTFNMNICTDTCGTPACIAGHANDKWAGFKIDPESACLGGEITSAQELLGLRKEEAWNLFAPLNWKCGFDYNARKGDGGFITKDHAVRCLRHFAETSDVDWEGTA